MMNKSYEIMLGDISVDQENLANTSMFKPMLNNPLGFNMADTSTNQSQLDTSKLKDASTVSYQPPTNDERWRVNPNENFDQ